MQPQRIAAPAARSIAASTCFYSVKPAEIKQLSVKSKKPPPRPAKLLPGRAISGESAAGGPSKSAAEIKSVRHNSPPPAGGRPKQHLPLSAAGEYIAALFRQKPQVEQRRQQSSRFGKMPRQKSAGNKNPALPGQRPD